MYDDVDRHIVIEARVASWIQAVRTEAELDKQYLVLNRSQFNGNLATLLSGPPSGTDPRMIDVLTRYLGSEYQIAVLVSLQRKLFEEALIGRSNSAVPNAIRAIIEIANGDREPHKSFAVMALSTCMHEDAVEPLANAITADWRAHGNLEAHVPTSETAMIGLLLINTPRAEQAIRQRFQTGDDKLKLVIVRMLEEACEFSLAAIVPAHLAFDENGNQTRLAAAHAKQKRDLAREFRAAYAQKSEPDATAITERGCVHLGEIDGRVALHHPERDFRTGVPMRREHINRAAGRTIR